MLITGRAACCELEQLGISARSARKVLAAGLAGEPVRTRAAHLYDEDRVMALTRTPALTTAEVDDLCPHGLFIARRDVRVGADREEQLAAVRDGWAFCVWTGLWLRLRMQKHGFLPFVVTVGGFVVLGADAVELSTRREDDGATTTVQLRDPGAWFDSVRGRRIPTGPGRPWVIHGCSWTRARVGQSTRQDPPHRQEFA